MLSKNEINSSIVAVLLVSIVKCLDDKKSKITDASDIIRCTWLHEPNSSSVSRTTAFSSCLSDTASEDGKFKDLYCRDTSMAISHLSLSKSLLDTAVREALKLCSCSSVSCGRETARFTDNGVIAGLLMLFVCLIAVFVFKQSLLSFLD